MVHVYDMIQALVLVGLKYVSKYSTHFEYSKL